MSLSNRGATDFGCLFLIIIAVLIIAFGPWLMFWAIEVLFNYHIDFNFKTWLAALILIGFASSGGTKSSS